MKKTAKLLFALMLSACLTATMIPATGFAADKTSSDKTLDKIVNGLSIDENEDPFDFEDAQSGSRLLKKAGADEGELPESFDLRKRGIVTPVKNQSPWGTCWGFAAIAASETSILSDMKKTYKEYPIDLSERHLSFFSLGHIEDKNDSQYGEGHWSINPDVDDYPWMRLNDGGEGFFATSLFASGIGPVNESDVPYQNKKGYIRWVKYDESGAITESVNSVESPGEDYVPYNYANIVWEDPEGSSWDVDEGDKFKQKYELEESCMLPSPAGKTVSGNYRYNEDGTDAMKGEIMKGYPVQIGFYADTSKPDESGEARYINQNTWAHYTYDTSRCNHAVTIVGWDDNYSRKNFISDHRPPYDGAWLVKNSWGAETNQFPNRGSGQWGILDDEGKHTGYFWLSYYDTSLTRPETLNFDTTKTGNDLGYYYVDAYDYMPIYSVGNSVVKENVRMANVFIAEGNMKLRTVSCQTATPGSTVTYRVYLLTDKQKTPKDAQLLTTCKDSFEYGGYHRTDLEKAVLIKKGEKYAVEVEVVTPRGKHEALISRAYNEEGIGMSGDDGYTKGVVNKGESFLFTGEKYMDWTDVLVGVRLNDGGIYDYDNFTIKAYSDPVTRVSRAVISSLKAGKNQATVTWKKLSKATGYQVSYRRVGKTKWYSKFVKSTTKSLTIKKLAKNKKYRFKVRGYTNINGRKLYGKWSAIKTVKVK